VPRFIAKRCDERQADPMSQAEDRLLYLEMLHNTVNRLGNQSFILKTLAFSGTGALITLDTAETAALGSSGFVGIALGAVLGIWLFDTQFMRTERAIRKMIQAVKAGHETDLFAWNINAYIKHVPLLRAAISWSLLWFYLGLLSVIIIVTIA
jgi:hypothetical protein